jgi:hypothetical protein
MRCSECNKREAKLVGWQGRDTFGRRDNVTYACYECSEKIDAYTREHGYVDYSWLSLDDICIDCFSIYGYENREVYKNNRCLDHYEQYIAERKKQWKVIKHEYIYTKQNDKA